MNKYLQTEVEELPDCDFCAQHGDTVHADFDGKTVLGPWANMCKRHFNQFGVGVGEGKGQRLVVRKPKA